MTDLEPDVGGTAGGRTDGVTPPRIGWWKEAKARVRQAAPLPWRFRLRVARHHGSPEFLYLPLAVVERRVIETRYRESIGRPLDLDCPRTFTEKIQWRKLYDRRPIWPSLVDKHRVREWVRSRVGGRFLVPLLWVGDAPSELPLDDLEPPYIVKPTHMSGLVYPVRWPDALDRDTRRQMVESLHWHLHTPYGFEFVEWAYWEVEPLVMVERLLLDSDGTVARDYKFHCFSGEPHFIEVHVDRFEGHARSTYDRGWNKLDLANEGRPVGPDVDRPPNLDTMLEVAARLAEGLDYVRVDLYNVDGRIYAGEMTIYPISGFARFRPDRWDRDWGRRWALPDLGREGRSLRPLDQKAADRT